jgi:addiction module HigA family antidote
MSRGKKNMLPTHRISTHPGVVLLKDFIEPAGLSQTAVAKKLKISTNRLNELVRGRRGVTPDTAWKLSALFSTSPEFWMNLQSAHDLTKARPRKRAA